MSCIREFFNSTRNSFPFGSTYNSGTECLYELYNNDREEWIELMETAAKSSNDLLNEFGISNNKIVDLLKFSKKFTEITSINTCGVISRVD